jgi:4-carboxymuconolactone decarboxylase
VSDNDGRLARGLATRREVLGDEHVDRSLSGATEFTAIAQDFVTEYCWGDVWTRPGLDRRTRSLINLGMLTALKRMHEFRVHVRGAINNGCTVEEIRETLLQAIVYCGAPAGLESFRQAQTVLDEMAATRA